jgi:prophage regulatory protein
MTQKLVSKKELKSVYGVPYSFQHIARLEAAGQFPTRIRLGACRVAWLSQRVDRLSYRNNPTRDLTRWYRILAPKAPTTSRLVSGGVDDWRQRTKDTTIITAVKT